MPVPDRRAKGEIPLREAGQTSRRSGGSAQRPVDAVPAEAYRGLVQPELAGVVQPKKLDRREMRRDQLSVLGRVVFADVPRCPNAARLEERG